MAGFETPFSTELRPAVRPASERPDLPWAPPPGLPTPFVLVHYERLLRNLERVQRIARNGGVGLRPHVKTHKTIELARLQAQHGAIGLTASKPSEAECFVRAGFRSILVAYPVINPDRVARLLNAAAASGTELQFMADSKEGVAALATAARNAGRTLGIHVKVDVGLHRCGVAPDGPALQDLALAIRAERSLSLVGLLSHAGHSYSLAGTRRLRDLAYDERGAMEEAKRRLGHLGFAPLRISVGATPTVLAAEDFAGIDEIRPGNYVFLDLTAIRLGIATEKDLAFGVVATIISSNRETYIIDAGSKSLTSDLGAHSSGTAGSFGLALVIDESDTGIRLPVTRLSEEHGFVSRQGTNLKIGTRLLILPNHACPIVNLYDELMVNMPSGEAVAWPVVARGAVT